MTLHLARFGGGVALLGSADTRQVDEVSIADGFDIGARGALVCTADAGDYAMATDFTSAPFARVLGLVSENGFDTNSVLVVGEGTSNAQPSDYIFARVNRTGSSAAPYASRFGSVASPSAPVASGISVTSSAFPGKFLIRFPGYPAPTLISAYFVNLGAREGTAPRLGRGLFAMLRSETDPVPLARLSQSFDMLGTGALGDYCIATGNAGTQAQQLYFRGIVAYNNHVFGWGFDSADTAYGDGPNRVMFCNLGYPLKWGNDNIGAAGTDRAFTDSDAIVLGDAGEAIRAGISYAGRLYFGTNRGLHFISGYGRDSFVTDGATPVMKAYNVVGPHALIEGPDNTLYGVSDQGLWSFTGQGVPTPLFQKVRDLQGQSAGYFDCIWTDPSGAGYPGGTNQDLVWMSVDWTRQQVCVWIPFCDATTGSGVGGDTVCLKYHPQTGGFTRQVFPGVCYTAGGFFRREGQQPDARLLGTATTGAVSVQRYGFTAANAEVPALPRVLPAARLGPYAPFGPDGYGVIKRAFLTLSWQDASTALPLVFRVETTADDLVANAFTLTLDRVAPGAPVAGDFWLDTAQTDPSLGNATAGVTIASDGGYLLKTYTAAGAWVQVAGIGATGRRVTLPLPLVRKPAARVEVGVTCLAAGGRFAIEGLGLDPGSGVEAA